jgi:hypothetical protein
MSLTQRMGGLTIPLAAVVVDSFAVLDPVRDMLLACFAAAINDEFGESWERVVDSLPATSSLAGTTPIVDTHPGEPTLDLMQTRKAGFPLLCLHRFGDPVFEPLLMDQDKLTQGWHLHYNFGPLDLEAQRKILDIGIAIGKVIKMIERDFGHSAYNSGENILESGSLLSLRLRTMTQPGPAQFAGDERMFWATRYTLETTELVLDVTDTEDDLEAFDLNLDASGANSPDTDFDFIVAQSDVEYQNP